MLNHFGLSELLNKVACPDQCLSVLVYHCSLVKMDRSHCTGQASGQQLPPHILAVQTLNGVVFNKSQWTPPSLADGDFSFFFFFSVVLGIEPMTSCILGKGSSTELHPQPQTAKHSMTSVNVGTHNGES